MDTDLTAIRLRLAYNAPPGTTNSTRTDVVSGDGSVTAGLSFASMALSRACRYGAAAIAIASRRL